MLIDRDPKEEILMGWDFVDFLQRELARRYKTNRTYSLRAFANFLEVESSYLSKLMRRSRPMNQNLIQKIGMKLSLSPVEIENYRKNLWRQRGDQKGIEAGDQKMLFIPQDVFEIIQDPNHYLILELMKMARFVPSEAWIAKRLKLSIYETRACLSRLQKVGLLEIRSFNEWVDLSEGASTHILSSMSTSELNIKTQKAILEKSIQALQSIPITQRDQSSLMVASSSQMLGIAKERIRSFRRDLGAELNAAPEKDTVFQLSISLFPLIESEDSKDKNRNQNHSNRG